MQFVGQPCIGKSSPFALGFGLAGNASQASEVAAAHP